MNHGHFDKVLIDAESLAGSPPLPAPDLARRVRRRLARRRARIAAGGVTLAVTLAVISFYVRPARIGSGRSFDSDLVAADAVSPPSADCPLDLIRIEVDSRMAIVRLMRERLATDNQFASPVDAFGEPPFDPRLVALQQIEESSLRLLLEADRLARDHRFHDAAIRQYQSVIRLFPGSAGSRAAGVRLAEVEKQGVL